MTTHKAISMTEGKPAILLLQFALPIVIGNLFNQVYNMVDSAVLGHWVSASALASVGVTNAPTQLFMSLAMGMTNATGILVAQYFGAKDDQKASASIANSMYVNLGVAAATIVISLFLTQPILLLLHTPVSLLKNAVLYMRILLCGLLPVTVYYTCFSVLRSLGDTRTPLLFLVFSSLLNMGLDLVFVIVFGLGVAGVAAATVVAQLVSAVLCMVYAFRQIPYFRMAWRYRRPNRHLIGKSLRLGIPVGIQFSLTHISNTIIQRAVNGFGESVITAFTVTSRVETLAQQPLFALATAQATYAAQNTGAGKIDRLKQGLQSTFAIIAAYSAILLALFWFGGKQLMRLFVCDSDVIAIGATGIRISGCFFLAFGIIQMLRNLLNGVGDANYALFSGVVEITGRVVLVMILMSIPRISRWSIWLANGLSWVITSVFTWVRYKRGKWAQKSLITDD